jgi:hypothetical protein
VPLILEFIGPNDINDLHELILATMPDLQVYSDGFHEDGTDRKHPRMEVIGHGPIVTLTVPDGTDSTALGIIVDNYMKDRR